jgi:hypothetical protein
VRSLSGTPAERKYINRVIVDDSFFSHSFFRYNLFLSQRDSGRLFVHYVDLLITTEFCDSPFYVSNPPRSTDSFSALQKNPPALCPYQLQPTWKSADCAQLLDVLHLSIGCVQQSHLRCELSAISAKIKFSPIP